MSGLAKFSLRTAIAAAFAALAAISPWSASRAQTQDMQPGAHGPMKAAPHPPAAMAHGMGAMAAKGPAFEPATVCKQCHEQIYREWSQSMMAHSREAWYFSHMLGSERMGMTCYNEKKVAIACRTCHEPAGVYPLGAVLQGKPPAIAATEGVSCDVCHRITEVKGTGDFAFGPKDIKLGPYKDSKSPYHKTAYAPLLQTSEFCDACHGQLNNHNGLTVCNTRSEWRESRYAKEGKTCQSCHMPAATGSAATVPGAPGYAPKNRPLHSHLFLGPHNDPALLREAATLEQSASQTGDGGLEIRVSVTNSGAGHDLPTGLPDRLITLKVEARDAAGKVVWQNWRHDAYREDRQAAFGLFGFNAKGGEVPPMGASRLVRLNLKPGATRVLRYRLPPGIARKVVRVESRLTYHAVRPENLAYFGVWGVTGTQPKPMADAATTVH